MNKCSAIQWAVLVAVALALAGMGVGCTVINNAAGAVADGAAAAGVITQDQAAGAKRVGTAMVKAVEDITPEQEYYVGRTVAATVLTKYRPKPEQDLNWYVNQVGQALAQFSTRPETFGGYHFLVLDSDEINAFAAPGGLILATRGLLKCCQTEDMLAAVLAHEIGHVEKQHGLRAIGADRWKSAGMTLGLEVGKNLAGEQLAEATKAFEGSINDITSTLMNSGYSRKLEYEADAAAVGILQRAGYQPGALAAMLDNMAKDLDSSRHDFAATHPLPSDRLAQLKKIGVVSTLASTNSRQQRFLAATKAL